MIRPLRLLAPLCLTLTLTLTGCAERLTRQEVYDPANCEECHSTHVEQWQMSMHAYAADDPVFLAMNARGQEETNGELGTFCVNCHAPVAVREGLTDDGLDLDELPQHMKGVTCAFCHLAVHEEDSPESNNPLELAKNLRLKGPFDDATGNPAHGTAYDPLLDRNQRESTDLCGPCHDIVLDNGVHLEQTFAEWKDTGFADDVTLTTCGNCHMLATGPLLPVADYEGVPAREFHDHRMPGVDVAITPWPGDAEYRQLTQEFLEDTVRAELCIDSDPPGWRAVVGLENVAAGHSFPSGSSQDRRVWVQLQAFAGDELLWESGVVDEGVPAVDVIGDERPGILLRDHIRNAEGDEVHMFWDVEQQPDRDVLSGIRQFGVEEIRVWDFTGPAFTEPDRVTLRVFERPIGLDVLDDLIDSQHLDPSFRDAMPTFELTGAALEWSGPPLGTCVQSDVVPTR